MRSKGLFSIKVTDWSVFYGDKDSIKKQKHDRMVIFLLQIVKKTAQSLLSASAVHIYRGNVFGESRHRGRRRKTFGMRVR